MNNKLVVALVCLGFAVPAKAEVNFDQGVDVKSAVKDAADMDIKTPAQTRWDTGYLRYDTDCQTLTYGANDAAVISARSVSLVSTEWKEDCNWVPDPQPHPDQPGHHDGPGGPGGPGGHHRTTDEAITKGTECHQYISGGVHRTVQINMAPRKLFPWETESVQACFNGYNTSVSVLRGAYTYNINITNNYDPMQYQFTPVNKVALAPDQDGLSAGEFSNSNGRFIFKVNDKWAAEYAGEKVAVKVELYKNGWWFFDSYKGSKEFTFDAAAGYELNFAENELDTSKSFGPGDDPSKIFTPGKGMTRGSDQYFLKWSFRRIGQISTGDSVNKDKTDMIEAK